MPKTNLFWAAMILFIERQLHPQHSHWRKSFLNPPHADPSVMIGAAVIALARQNHAAVNADENRVGPFCMRIVPVPSLLNA